MTTMQATAVISAVDRASAVFRRVSATAQAVAGRFGALTTAAQRVGNAATGPGSFGAAIASGYFLHQQFEFEKALNRTQAILDITSKERFKPLRDEVVRLAEAYPAMRTEIAKGASELAMSGMKLDTVKGVLEGTIQGMMASGESIATVGMGVTDVIMSMALPFRNAQEQMESFALVNDKLSAAQTTYNQNYTQFLAGLAKTGPVARAAGLSLHDNLAVLGALANAGIKAERGGTGFAGLMLRLGAPTKKARAELRALGIDVTKFQRQRGEFASLGGEVLADRLAEELGMDASELVPSIDQLLSDKRLTDNAGALGDALTKLITEQLGVGVGDAESRAKIQDAVSAYVRMSFSTLDVIGLFREFAEKDADKSLTFLNEVAGKWHAAKLAAILSAMRDGNFDQWSDDLMRKTEGATKRFAGIMQQGFVGAVYRMQSAWDAFLDRLANTGVLDTVTGTVRWLTDAIGNLAETNPTLLKWATYAVLAAGAMAPLALTIGGISSGFAALGLAVAGVVSVFGGPLVAAFAAAAAAGVALYAYWDEITAAAKDFAATVRRVVQPAIDGIAAAFRTVLDSITGIWDRLVERIEAAIGKIRDAINWLPWIGGKADVPKDAPGTMFGFEPPKTTPGAKPLIRDIDPKAGPANVNVQGEAKVDVESKVKIEIEGAPARVIEQTPGKGTARVPLDTGRSMPDTGMGAMGVP